MFIKIKIILTHEYDMEYWCQWVWEPATCIDGVKTNTASGASAGKMAEDSAVWVMPLLWVFVSQPCANTGSPRCKGAEVTQR